MCFMPKGGLAVCLAGLPRLEPGLKIAVERAARIVHEYFMAVVYAEKNRFIPLPVQRLGLFKCQNVDVFYILNLYYGKCLNIALFLRPLHDDKSVIEVVLPAQQQHGVVGLQTMEVSFAVNSQQPYIGLADSMRRLRLCVDVLKQDAAKKK